MSLTFLTPLMLAGAALVAAPIILHLVMRQQPKHLIFPALQFIRQRSSSNRRKLKLRHLILLALRCAAIVFLALALARPSLQATGWLGDQEAPIAAAIVFDTSPRMQYRHQNQTRLEVAQEVAEKVLKQLPRESDVAVLDSRTLEAAFSIDAAVARQKITRLSITAAAQPLPELCSQGLRLVSESSRGRKEVYVFTDLGRQAWSAEAAARLREKLANKTDVALYIIDVGVEDPKDLSLGDLRPSAESLAKNSPLSLQTELVADGAVADDRGVAIYTIDPSSGELQLRSQSPAKATPEQPQPVDFQIDGLELGVHQGVVRIAGEDSLPSDDSRYFTVDVRPPWKVLVVAPKPVERRASLLTEPISPTPFRRTGQARFECDVIGFDELAAKSLDDYAAVCLLDPPPMTDAVWQSLAGFAERGGGVAIWLGRHAQPQGHTVDEFNTAASQAVMPGKISRIWHRQDAFLAPGDYQHPMLAKFRGITGGVPWEEFAVDSHWQLADFAAGVNPIMAYSNGQPAILEKSLGKGRVLVFTTPISDEVSDEPLWNTLAIGSEHWPYFMLVNEAMLYLVGSGEDRLNFWAGETAVVHLPENERQMIFSLRTPEGEEFPQSIDQKTGTITITTTGSVGNYLLRAGGTQGGVRRGFSVNVPAANTDLKRLSRDELTALLGDGKFRLSRGRDEIERNVNLDRTGREMYPLLIILVALLLGAEHLLANKFYRRDPQSEESTRKRVAELAAETAAERETVGAA
jgi:Aerotolerance regulator N-terminal